MTPAPGIDLASTLSEVDAAARAGQITPSAVVNLRRWLTEPRYEQYAATVAELVAAERWRELDDVFWTVIPFGTGGRRGRMFPVGSNAINDRTIGESAQGLADYVREQLPAGNPRCALAYDTRHQSRHFAELCAEVMVANGFQVRFLDGHRSTPELSFAVRATGSACGIMVTASHNPPSDNAVKAYWSTGGQILPPHDRGVIERVMNVDEIRRVPFAQALAAGQIEYCQASIDGAYQAAVLGQRVPGPRHLKILYSPMHGVGATSVCPVLAADGFADVEVFAPHATPDGDFPNVPDHVANPENPATFDAPIAHARQTGAELILSTDPDADRLGCAAPLTWGGSWRTFTGNQIGALLTDYVLATRRASGRAVAGQYLIKTLVTTEMIRRIGQSYNTETWGDLQVGFKWIGGLIDEQGPERFVLGLEESHGYLTGDYVRDKDAAVAAMLLAEAAAVAKAAGKTLHQQLDALFWQHGCHVEQTRSKTMPGSQGMVRMQQLLAHLRAAPPTALAGLRVRQVRDYQRAICFTPQGETSPLAGPAGDMLVFDLELAGNYVAVRPSGTEPKVKFYLFAYQAAELLGDLEESKAELTARTVAMYEDLAAVADALA